MNGFERRLPRGSRLARQLAGYPLEALSLALILAFLTVALATSSSYAQEAQSAARGKLQEMVLMPDKPEAPDFTLTDTDGNTHTLSDYRGKVVVVNFWATWCAPCRKEMPSMQQAWEQLRDQDVMMLAVNWGDEADAVAKFFEKIPVDFPVLLGGDQEMTREWSVMGLPTTFVLDPEGRRVYRVIGDIEWNTEEVKSQILALKG